MNKPFLHPILRLLQLGMIAALLAVNPLGILLGANTPTANAPKAPATNVNPVISTSTNSSGDPDQIVSDDKDGSVRVIVNGKHDPSDASLVSDLIDNIIPLVAIISTFGMPVLIVFFITYFKYRRRRENLALAREFLNKGLPVPPELLDPSQRVLNDLVSTNRAYGSNCDLRKGIRLTFIGLGISIALYIHSPHSTTWAWGLIPMIMGIGFLVSGWTENRSGPPPDSFPRNQPPPPGNPL